jgi:hypothetical protein
MSLDSPLESIAYGCPPNCASLISETRRETFGARLPAKTYLIVKTTVANGVVPNDGHYPIAAIYAGFTYKSLLVAEPLVKIITESCF